MIEKSNLTELELQENYHEFIKFIDKIFTGERKEKLLFLYSENEMGMAVLMSPASLAEHYHLAFPGGYLIHIMHVIKCSFGVKRLYETMGGTIDWSDEEMVFSAMHHDLGKLGDKETGEYYVNQDNDWKRKNGELYKLNSQIQYMEVTDRAIYTLQKYGVKITQNEYLSIKLADGLYNEASKKYLIQFNPDMFLKSNLPRIIHIADYLSCRSEFDSWKSNKL